MHEGPERVRVVTSREFGNGQTTIFGALARHVDGLVQKLVAREERTAAPLGCAPSWWRKARHGTCVCGVDDRRDAHNSSVTMSDLLAVTINQVNASYTSVRCKLLGV
jgi:hypothetical protein